MIEDLKEFSDKELRDASLAGRAALTLLASQIERMANDGDVINERVGMIEAEIQRRLTLN